MTEDEPEINEILSRHLWPLSGSPAVPDEYPPVLNCRPRRGQTIKTRVNKNTHKVRFQEESESEVTIITEPT